MRRSGGGRVHVLTNPTTIGIATGLDCPDALSGGAMPAKQGGGRLLPGAGRIRPLQDMNLETARRASVGERSACAWLGDSLANAVKRDDRRSISVRQRVEIFLGRHDAGVAHPFFHNLDVRTTGEEP